MIFHCYGGAHSSVTSSGIYLGLLPRDRVPDTAEILQVPHYDGDEPIAYGHFRFVGRDQAGRVVYVLGKRRLGPHINRLLIVVAGIFGRAGNIFSVDTTAPVNVLMMCGGYVSRDLKLVSLGRPFVVRGTKLAYFRFVQLAIQSEQRLLENHAVPQARVTSGCRGAGLVAFPPRVIFYICPDVFRYPLLTAGFHVYPGASDGQVLGWVRRQSFSGAVGSVLFAGQVDDLRVYLVGAGRNPDLVGRIIRELRLLLEVPQSEYLVVTPGVRASYAGLLAARGCRLIGLDRLYRLWEEQLFKKKVDACRRESGDVIMRLKEAILD